MIDFIEPEISRDGIVRREGYYCVRLTMIGRSTYLSLPMLGIVETVNAPTCQVGKLIKFLYGDQPLALGYITAIESPGSSLRPESSTSKYKVHWIPIDLNYFETMTIKRDTETCVKCKVKAPVVGLERKNNTIIRYRKCGKCHTGWLTTETFSKYQLRSLK